ncbi:MAG: acylphosphatase [Enterococcus sp.]
MLKARMNVQGRVQGVGFRYTTKILADSMGVHGTVKNEEDGSVTIEAIAPRDIMTEFINKVKKSPSPAGRVTQVDITDDSLIPDRETFDVLY